MKSHYKASIDISAITTKTKAVWSLSSLLKSYRVCNQLLYSFLCSEDHFELLILLPSARIISTHHHP